MAKYWFKQKAFGYGAGLPICWQGWALVGGFVGALLLSTALVLIWPSRQAIFLHLLWIGIALVPFLWVARAKTEGGWRWRWGGDPGP